MDRHAPKWRLGVEEEAFAAMDSWAKEARDREAEACYFAMCLLMPEKFVREDIAALGGIDWTENQPVRDLARRYGVSVPLMTLRLAQLGLAKRRR